MKAQEQKPLPDLQLYRLQAELAAVHVAEGFGARGPAQRAVQIIDPAVERADHRPLAMALCPVHHPRAPVAAQVVKGAHHAVAAPDHHRAFPQQIEGQPVAGCGNVIHMPCNLPVLQKQLAAFKIEQRLGMIRPAGQSPAIPGVRNGVMGNFKGHGRSPSGAHLCPQHQLGMLQFAQGIDFDHQLAFGLAGAAHLGQGDVALG